MNNEQYKKTQDEILKLVPVVRDLDLDGFLERIYQSETTAPFIDPTSYKYASINLGIIKDLAMGLKKFQGSIPEIQRVIEGQMLALKHPTCGGL